MQHQRGIAMVVLLGLFSVVLLSVLLTTARSAPDPSERDQITTRALGMARDALIARAATDITRPGSLPCPDTNNDGTAESPVASGGVCPSYLGRLPWKTLDLPDLRDGNGERLWYAVSPVFRDYPTAGTLNSDTSGQLTVNAATTVTGVIAVILAPGAALSAQDRSGANQLVAGNYLEGNNANAATTIYDGGAETSVFNDRLLLITADTLFPPVEQRVAQQVLSCLRSFAQQLDANGHYPWPSTNPTTYEDNDTGALFGRIPASLSNTINSFGGASPTWPNDNYAGATTTQCFSWAWWSTWRAEVFYAVAAAYAPSTAAPGSCSTGCLRVNTTDSVAVAVMVGGRAITTGPVQTRPGIAASDYLETDPVSGIDNAQGIGIYAKGNAARTPSMSFNDRLACLRANSALPCP